MMTMDRTRLLLIGCMLFNGITLVVPAKILFLYPIPYPSHYRAFSPLIEKLADRGHQITAYTGFGRSREDQNYTEISITVDSDSLQVYGWETVSWRTRSSIALINGIWSFYPQITEAALKSKELQKLMRSQEHFDLIIMEATFMEESLLAFGHKFNAPVVNLNPIFMSTWQAHAAGIPHSFSYIPNVFLAHTDRMTVPQRVKNTLVGLYELMVGNFWYLPMQEAMMRRHFNYTGSESLPSLKELISNISLHLVDSHPLMSYVRPYPSNVIDVAGMNLNSAGKLPQDLQQFMDEATNGVIYVSFGSYIDAKEFSKETNKLFVDTFSGLKERVIWRWSEKVDASHILTRSWLPQLEILAHPNCKLFITHGGFNSLMEAMSIGVPVIGIPFFGDQYFDVAFYENRGVGLEINLETTTASEFRSSINRVIQTPSYRENAKHLATLFRDEPWTSLEKAVYWVEYVIRHKGAHHLKPASLRMPYYQYLLLDVIAFLAVSITVVVWTLYFFVRKIIRLFTNAGVNVAKKNQ